MRMYPIHDLYYIYLDRLVLTKFSKTLPDVTKRITLENMNFAINICDKWERCMDIGGGTGHYLTALAGKFEQAILIEPEKHPEHAELIKYNNISIFHEYIEKYNSKEKVDFILLADLYEHIPDIKLFIKQLATLQNENGVVYIMTPNPIVCGPATESGLYHTRHTNGHIKQYTKNEIVAIMNTGGYELELELFEEAPLRQKLKKILFALSWRDKKWSQYKIYRVIRPLYIIISHFIFAIIGLFTYGSEKKNRHNCLNTLTQDLVFKKKHSI